MSILIISGCQAKSEQQKETAQSTSSVNPISINEVPTKPSHKPLCKKNYSPPIKDITKLKEMLIKSGKITTDMNEAEVKIAINKYIQNKRAAFKKCNK